MATEKQIAANRANAQKSTGPKTAAGRLKSSRNALSHGLSCPLPFDPAMSAKVEAIAQALAGEGASEDQMTSAAEFAQAQLELLRIRAIRAETMRDTDLKLGSTQDLRRLLALDRYERYAHTKRRRAARKTSTLGTQAA
jgi:hypothetical protein